MSSETSIRSQIGKALASGHPETVGQLARQIGGDEEADEVEFVETIKSMAREKAIDLEAPTYEVQTFLDYLFLITLSGWLWAVSAITILSLVVVLTIPDVFPFDVPRWLLGSILVLFLPGYSLMQLLLSEGKELDSLERFALDIGVSLAVVPLIGLLLNFTPWGIRIVPIIASLTVFIALSLIGAALRKYWAVRVSTD